MTTQPTSVADFLLRRLDEDEAAARAAMVDARYVQFGDTAAEALLGLAESEGAQEEALQHFARHDPARVLAQVEAMRAVVALHQPLPDNSVPTLLVGACAVCVSFHADMDCENEAWPCPTLRALARVYASHPEFDERWSA